MLEKIKSDRDSARKSQEKAKVIVLSTLIGEVENVKLRKGSIDDAGIVSIVKKFVQSNNDTMNASGLSFDLMGENNILMSYIPTQLDEASMIELLHSMDNATIQGFMKELKDRHAGRFDGKLAAQVFKEYA